MGLVRALRHAQPWFLAFALLASATAARAEGVSFGAFPDVSRRGHTATPLANGLVLVAGGMAETPGSPNGPVLDTSDLYDTSRGEWIAAGRMARGLGHTATLLRNGRVLVTGGGDDYADTDTCEIFNPETNRWATTDSLATTRTGHTATQQLVRQPGGELRYRAADGIAPHLNTYSTSIEIAAQGGCWTCIVNPMPITVR